MRTIVRILYGITVCMWYHFLRKRNFFFPYFWEFYRFMSFFCVFRLQCRAARRPVLRRFLKMLHSVHQRRAVRALPADESRDIIRKVNFLRLTG